MGCCSAREFPIERKIVLHQPVLHQDINEEELRRVEEYYFRQCWYQLGCLCYSAKPVARKNGLQWAYPPTTVGSLAIQLLATQAYKDPAPLKDLPALFPLLLHYIHQGPEDARENSLLLLSASLPVWTQATKTNFVELDAFNLLCRFLMCSKIELCLCVASICHELYKFQADNQLAFANARGGGQLLQLILRCSEDRETLLVLLTYIEELLSLGDQGMNHLVSARLKYSMASEVLTDIKSKRVPDEVSGKLNEVLAMLSRSFESSTRC